MISFLIIFNVYRPKLSIGQEGFVSSISDSLPWKVCVKFQSSSGTGDAEEVFCDGIYIYTYYVWCYEIGHSCMWMNRWQFLHSIFSQIQVGFFGGLGN